MGVPHGQDFAPSLTSVREVPAGAWHAAAMRGSEGEQQGPGIGDHDAGNVLAGVLLQVADS